MQWGAPLLFLSINRNQSVNCNQSFIPSIYKQVRQWGARTPTEAKLRWKWSHLAFFAGRDFCSLCLLCLCPHWGAGVEPQRRQVTFLFLICSNLKSGKVHFQIWHQARFIFKEIRQGPTHRLPHLPLPQVHLLQRLDGRRSLHWRPVGGHRQGGLQGGEKSRGEVFSKIMFSTDQGAGAAALLVNRQKPPAGKISAALAGHQGSTN